MAEHECVIGLMYYGEQVTISDLKSEISERRDWNRRLRENDIAPDYIYKKEWTLKDYADKRKSTDLTRFNFCPECGKPIDWKAIRRMADG